MNSTQHDGDTRPGSLALAFAPIHKSALGVAVGLTSGLFVAALTLFHLLLRPEHGVQAPDGPEIGLLAQYFYGYEVSWSGVLVGMFWGFSTGFVLGWFLAFVRNVIVTISLFAIRTKAELAQTADFLDHI